MEKRSGKEAGKSQKKCEKEEVVSIPFQICEAVE
jgi:hypothetical protein